MDRYGADRIIDLEATLHPVVQAVSAKGSQGSDQSGLERVVEIISGRSRDDSSQPSRKGPEGVAAADRVAREETAR